MNELDSALGRLCRSPQGGVSVHQFSSHNRKGLNSDANGHLYKDEHGDCVIFDSEGPGVIRSMWGTCITDKQVLKFYFDGESQPRYEIGLRAFYSGAHPLFPPPLVSYERRGTWGEHPYAGNSFVPIPFARSLKVSVAGSPGFYHIIHERYPHGTVLETFTGHEDHRFLLEAFAPAADSAAPPPDAAQHKAAADRLAPYATLDLLKIEGSGCVRRLELEADGSDDFLRDVFIQMTWDDLHFASVLAPTGFFFGSPLRAEDSTALHVSMNKLAGGRVRLRCSFPMPFHKGAHISLVSRSAHKLGPVSACASVCPRDVPPESTAYFSACFRRGVTEYGRDWTFVETPGAGWFVGAVQTMVGLHYCEGDEHFSIDGACSPQINGTGSEDYYLCCYWPNPVFSTPFAGSLADVQAQGGGHFDGAYRFPAAYYRFHIEAPIPFYSSIDARIQHGAESEIASNYSSLAFYYLRPRPATVETDFLDVANQASERAHGYSATQSTPVRDLEARCEGNWLHTPLRDSGRSHAGGEIVFSVAINPRNNGVRLRRRLDQASARQSADVYVDGQFAGRWYHADHNPHLRWFDSDFDIHPDLTRDKDSLALRLAVVRDDGRGEFTDFAYRVYCVEAGPR